ncbi:MAG: aminofutalosine synthase MqnE [Acidobacteria bacterium]|nr:aminofutalosine synthase MqnE [Acidobacteriota bacterium]MBI3426598.1 aminofutalosine synthase MqnE [Acidobacteriota bacterium]
MLETYFLDRDLLPIAEKVSAGERLSFDDGMTLFRSHDLHGVGRLADIVRRRKHGLATYFNVNRHLNPTNYCYADCKFCGFFVKHNQEGGYTHSLEESLNVARAATAQGATELHIVGGLNTRLPFSYYTDLLAALKREFPKLHLKAFTMVELDFFAKFYKMTDEEVIAKLTAAGMDSCPGGGAEVFAEATREKICTHKTDGQRWLDMAGKVHQAGIKTNATILYGHVETTEDRVDHFVRLREQQDKSGGFQCFIPLAFYPPGTQLAHLPGPSGIDSLKVIAVSRLLLDNFDHIKAYWVMLGKRLAQTALHFGANDFDGTITGGGELMESYLVEGKNDNEASKDDIVTLIKEAGFEPIERDTLYHPLRKFAAA